MPAFHFVRRAVQVDAGLVLLLLLLLLLRRRQQRGHLNHALVHDPTVPARLQLLLAVQLLRPLLYPPRSVRKPVRDFRPLVAQLVVQTQYHSILLRCHAGFVDERREAVNPALSAGFCSAHHATLHRCPGD